MKKLKGFTLIELIVVIAIIGVLAAILVPAMMNWVSKSKITTYNNNASEVCTQLQIVLTDLDSQGLSVDKECVLIYKNGTVDGVPNTSGNAAEVQKRISDINQNLTDMAGTSWAAKIGNGTVEAVVFTGNGSKNVGGFPIQCPTNASYIMGGDNIEKYIDCAYRNASGVTWETKKTK